MTNQKPTARFVEVARAYIDFDHDPWVGDGGERLRRAASLLALLYAAALELPNMEPTDSEPAPDTDGVGEGWVGFGELDCYYEVFDPYILTEPLVGSLSDDMLDVARDVAEGLVLYDRGEAANAVWTWNCLRESHWGDHAVDALRALQRAMKAQPVARALTSEDDLQVDTWSGEGRAMMIRVCHLPSGTTVQGDVETGESIFEAGNRLMEKLAEEMRSRGRVGSKGNERRDCGLDDPSAGWRSDD